MNILVCVKEVPDLDPEVELEIDPKTNWIGEDDTSRYMLNRFDEVAIEEALLIRERFEDSRIDAITVGPERSQAVARRAMGMGVDHGIHITTALSGYLDPLLVSKLIADIARKKAYDLILTGIMAEDTLQGQTGIMIAALLGLPWASSVIREEIAPDRKSIEVQREIEGGLRDLINIPLPCLLTLQTGINQPRYPALSKVLKARKAELECYQAAELCPDVQGVKTTGIDYPRKERKGEVLEGSLDEKADQLLNQLLDRSLIQ